MKTLATKLVLAALVAAASPASPARACDRDGDGREALYPPPDRLPPPPAAPVRYRDRDGDEALYPPPDRFPPPGPRWQEDARPWREHSQLRREFAEIRAEMRDLDARRAEFYARFGWHPGKVRRFERWYAFRRAELERRLGELRRVAWWR